MEGVLKQYSIFGILVITLIFFGCIGGGTSKSNDGWQLLEEKTTTVENCYYYQIAYQLEKGEQIKIELNVNKGSNINFLLANSLQYSDFAYYQGGGNMSNDLEFEVYRPNVGSVATEPLEVQAGGIYYIVVDNSGAFNNGATPSGPVTVDLKIYLKAAS